MLNSKICLKCVKLLALSHNEPHYVSKEDSFFIYYWQNQHVKEALLDLPLWSFQLQQLILDHAHKYYKLFTIIADHELLIILINNRTLLKDLNFILLRTTPSTCNNSLDTIRLMINAVLMV